MNAIGRLVALLVLFFSFNLTGATQMASPVGSTTSRRATDKVVISTIAATFDVASDHSKWHKIKIKVSAPANAPDEMKHLSARTREGFYLNHR
jgi:hypothetical protein